MSLTNLFRNRPLLCIFGAALLLRLCYFLETLHTPVVELLQIDASFYHNWALKIAGGDLLGGNRVFFMAPFYAYFLAAVYAVFGHSYLIALLLQLVIGSLSCVLVYLIGRKYFDDKVALVSAVLAVIYPVFIFYDAVLLKENLMVFSLLLFALIYPFPGAKKDAPADKRWYVSLFFSGVLIAVHSLMRANIFLLLPLLAGYEYFKYPKAVLARKWGILLLGMFVVVFPVALRNKIVGNEWVVTVAEGGMNFWTGNNEKSTGAYVGADFITSQEPQYEDEDFRKEASRRAGRELTLKEASDYWYRQGFQFITGHPRQFAWLLWRKALAFVHATELPSDLSYYFARDFSKILQWDRLSFGLILPFAVIGLVLAARSNPPSVLFAFIILSNLLSSLIFFNSSRYRLPVVPCFLLFAGFCLVHLYERRTDRAYLQKLGLLALPFFLLANYPDRLLASISYKRVSYLNAATYYMSANNYPRAEAMLRRCLALDPAYPLGQEKYYQLLLAQGRKDEAENFLRTLAARGLLHTAPRRQGNEEYQAMLLFQQRRYAEAARLFSSVLSKGSANAAALHNNIGLCHLKMNEFDKAEHEFRLALEKDRNYDKACYNLGLLFERQGDLAQARSFYQKSLSLNPANPKARQKIQQLK